MLQASGRLGDVKQAEALMSELVHEGLEPNVHHFIAIVKAYVNRKVDSPGGRSAALRLERIELDVSRAIELVDEAVYRGIDLRLEQSYGVGLLDEVLRLINRKAKLTRSAQPVCEWLERYGFYNLSPCSRSFALGVEGCLGAADVHAALDYIVQFKRCNVDSNLESESGRNNLRSLYTQCLAHCVRAPLTEPIDVRLGLRVLELMHADQIDLPHDDPPTIARLVMLQAEQEGYATMLQNWPPLVKTDQKEDKSRCSSL